MTQSSIEHVNITVGDPEKTAAMLCNLFGWEIRWRGRAALGGGTIHVGTMSHYLAVYTQDDSDGTPREHKKGLPFNHIGIEVGDLDATEKRVLDMGMVTHSHGDYEPGRRFYFFDPDGIEYEVVSYA